MVFFMFIGSRLGKKRVFCCLVSITTRILCHDVKLNRHGAWGPHSANIARQGKVNINLEIQYVHIMYCTERVRACVLKIVSIFV
jgi:hypothetical protein